MIQAGPNGLNIRSGPDIDYTRLAHVEPGTQFRVIGRYDDWWQIDYNGLPAWAFSGVVTAYNTDTNAVTVIRGVNGSTAAIHVNGATIYVYQAPGQIQHATLRLANWLDALKDAPTEDPIQSLQTGLIYVPKGAPSDVHRVCMQYRRHGL